MNKWERRIHFQQNKSKYIKRGTIALSVVLLIVGVIYITYSKFESTQEYTLINGKIVGGGDASIIAIYQGDTKVDSIPAKGSGYYFKNAECSNGATASWNNIDWSLNVNTSGKTKCTLYFVQGTNAVTYINNLGQTDTTNLIADGTSDNNLRYVGANPNNYVRFNNELWRIIGVMNNIKTAGGTTESLIKLIRNESLGNYVWDSSDSSVNTGDGINQWGESTYTNGSFYEGADLMRELNNDYLGNIKVGSDGKWYDSNKNSKNEEMPSSTLSQASQGMIESVIWNLGSGSYPNDFNNFNSNDFYGSERDLNNNSGYVTRTSVWKGYVGLIYVSDFGFATSGGNTINRSQCLNNTVYSYDESEYGCMNNDWLKSISNSYWTLFTLEDGSAVTINYGSIDCPSVGCTDGVVPVVFLKSSIAITGGAGTESNPYTLG